MVVWLEYLQNMSQIKYQLINQQNDFEANSDDEYKDIPDNLLIVNDLIDNAGML